MKRITALLLTLVMIFSYSYTAFAYEGRLFIVTPYGTKDITTSAKISLLDGYSAVAAKPVFEAAGATVTWLSEEKAVAAMLPNKRVMIITYDGTNRMFVQVNGKVFPTTATVTPKLVNGTAMVAEVDIARLLGASPQYDPTTKNSFINLVDGRDLFDTPSEDDDLCSVEEFYNNGKLRLAYVELAKRVILNELKYPNTAYFATEFECYKVIHDENSPSLSENFEKQIGYKLDAETKQLIDEHGAEYGERYYENVHVRGYVTAQNEFGIMKQVPIHVIFDVVNKEVNSVYLDNRLLDDYLLHQPSYSLEGYYY